MRTILVFGLLSYGKSTLGNKLAQKLDCDHLNADQVGQNFNDRNFYDEGRLS